MRIATALLALALAAAADDAAALLARGDEVFRSRDYASATKLYEQAAAAAEAAGQRSLFVEAASQAARGYHIRGKPFHERGRAWLERAAAKATDKDPKGWSRYLGVRGRFEAESGHKEAAIETFERMYAYCLEHKLHSRAIDAAHMVGLVGTREQKIAWAHKGIEAAEKGGFDGWLGPLWNNLGLVHDDAGEYEKALACYLKARHYHWKVGNEVSKLIADWAVGMTYRKLGRHDRALQWLRPVLAWAERLHAERPGPERGEWIGLACREIGYVKLATGDKAAAGAYLERAEPLLRAVKMAEWDKAGWDEFQKRLAECRSSLAPPRQR